MDLSALGEVIDRFGTQIIDSMKAELDTTGSIATGELLESISYEYQIDVDRILVQFLSSDYGKYVDSGRAAGTYPPITAIQQWCEVKGIPVKAAFPIAKNIFKFGIKPKPFILEPLNNLKQDFIIALMVVYGQQVQIEVKDMFKAFPKQIIVPEGN